MKAILHASIFATMISYQVFGMEGWFDSTVVPEYGSFAQEEGGFVRGRGVSESMDNVAKVLVMCKKGSEGSCACVWRAGKESILGDAATRRRKAEATLSVNDKLREAGCKKIRYEIGGGPSVGEEQLVKIIKKEKR